jgi:hypothetical protein
MSLFSISPPRDVGALDLVAGLDARVEIGRIDLASQDEHVALVRVGGNAFAFLWRAQELHQPVATHVADPDDLDGTDLFHGRLLIENPPAEQQPPKAAACLAFSSGPRP